MNLYTKIIGTGSYLPERRVSNDDLAQELAKRGIETSDEWIAERTGIRARRFAEPGVFSSDLGTKAAQAALDAADKKPSDIDLIIVATSTPDMIFPSTATIIQRKLGIAGCPAFDVQAVCTGFIYALTVADAMIRSGSAHCALVIGAEVFSRILDFNDRSTCVLFGDGAGAIVVEASTEPGILATEIHADGNYNSILRTPGYVDQGKVCGNPYLEMEGQSVFKLAVNALYETSTSVLKKAGKTVADVDWRIPHQANIRIMQSIHKKLGMPDERLVATVSEHGNTSAASVPLALDSAIRAGTIQKGQTLLLEGVGGGFTWGAILLTY